MDVKEAEEKAVDRSRAPPVADRDWMPPLATHSKPSGSAVSLAADGSSMASLPTRGKPSE